MSRMSEKVRQLVGLENVLVKARRRFRECEREEPGNPHTERYRDVIARISDEIHSADRERCHGICLVAGRLRRTPNLFLGRPER